MMKLGKIGILVLTLLLSVKVINVQACRQCNDLPSQKKISFHNIDYKSSKRYPQTIIYDIVNDFLFHTDNHKEKGYL